MPLGNSPKNLNQITANILDYDSVVLIDESKNEYIRVPIVNFEQRTGNNLTQSISDNAIPYWNDGNTEFLDSPLVRNGGDVNQNSGSFNQTGSGIYLESSIEVDTSVNNPQTIFEDRNSTYFLRIDSAGDLQYVDSKGNAVFEMEGANMVVGTQNGNAAIINTNGSDFSLRNRANTGYIGLHAKDISLDGGTTVIGSSELNLLNGMTAVSGADTTFISGTSGTSGNLIEWNIDGDAVDSSVATSDVMTDLIDDASPQLGGNLDMNGNLIQDTNGNELIEFTATTSAVNHFQIVNAATGNGSELQAVGGDTNIDLLLTPKGSGIISSTADLSLDGGTTTISSSELNLLNGMSSKTGADANFVTGTSGTSGNLVEWNVDGDVIDTGVATSNVLTDVVNDTTPQLGGNLNVNGNVLVDTNSNELITFTSNTSAVNEVDIANAATGNTPVVSASGGDTNIDLGLSAQGTGVIDLQSAVSIVDGNNISLGTTNGTQFGTGTSQLLAFYGSTPVTQPSTTGVTTGFTQGTGSTVTDDSTFTGNTGTTAYTIGDLVNHLKTLGLLAS